MRDDVEFTARVNIASIANVAVFAHHLARRDVRHAVEQVEDVFQVLGSRCRVAAPLNRSEDILADSVRTEVQSALPGDLLDVLPHAS